MADKLTNKERAALQKGLRSLLTLMDNDVFDMSDMSAKLQTKITGIVKAKIFEFEIENGKYVPTQDFTKQLLTIEQNINQVLFSKEYTAPLQDFLKSFDDIEKITIDLHKTFNDLKDEIKSLTPAKKFIHDQAEYSLTTGLKSEYVQPMQQVLMQQITSNTSITDSIKMLDKWNDGTLRPIAGERVPNLDQYVTQIARDSSYAVNGTINNIIKDELGLPNFIYVGDIIRDTRPLCKHLVDLDRPISFEELEKLIKEYPSGLYPDTNVQNFCKVRGGYNCRHEAFPVR